MSYLKVQLAIIAHVQLLASKVHNLRILANYDWVAVNHVKTVHLISPEAYLHSTIRLVSH